MSSVYASSLPSNLLWHALYFPSSISPPQLLHIPCGVHGPSNPSTLFLACTIPPLPSSPFPSPALPSLPLPFPPLRFSLPSPPLRSSPLPCPPSTPLVITSSQAAAKRRRMMPFATRLLLKLQHLTYSHWLLYHRACKEGEGKLRRARLLFASRVETRCMRGLLLYARTRRTRRERNAIAKWSCEVASPLSIAYPPASPPHHLVITSRPTSPSHTRLLSALNAIANWPCVVI